MTDTPVLLSLSNITKRFGALTANDSISLDLHRGEILALLGENGAGKTTLMNILFGHYVQDEGDVRVLGNGGLRALPPGSPGAALRAGIGMVHQHFTLAENLSGLANIRLGTEPLVSFGREGAARAKVQKIIAESGLDVDLERRVADLTVGEKQRIEILKALYRDAKVLILDEPTAVLTPQEAEGLFAVLRRLAANGLGVIFISHKLGEVLAVSHRILVLRGGKTAGELETAVADRRAIADLMVGKAVAAVVRTPANPGEVLFALEDVSLHGAGGGRALSGVHLTLRAGEVVGLAGVSGNGQSGIAALISGLAVPTSGTMRLYGDTVTRPDPRALVAKGVARMPEDRQHDGVVGTMSVADNIAIEEVRSGAFSRMGLLDRKAMRERAASAISAYDVRCQGPDAEARLLSGGNVQKLILARVLERGPRVILANQPTRGLDVGAQAEVHRRILAARDRGAAVLVISEDLDELFALADRFVVVHAGELQDAGPSDGLDRGTIGLMMAGQGPAAAELAS
ncbi:simple sugar transport system ATP-binding protein [Devosia crocina]|uniref:Simple sugar transport system ATP-binding protein n=1 Tax=Devosia crocina TaxID=429728 RepID=A0A1I7NKE9_9HYPH|nr:ABC transporter ATP-binding protein [Devosia crocina]SFV35100.1 simple sugar transport system ATP-binding protein [Devosia crocina]